MLRALESRGHYVQTYEWGDNQLPSVIDQDWVIHIGGNSSTVERDIDKILTQNYDFSRQLFNACKTYGVNLQYASSASVYGMGQDFKETAPADPKTPYAWSKYLFERYHLAHQGGNIVQGFRYFNVYGPEGEEHKGKQASPYMQFKQQYQETGRVKIFENSDEYLRDFIHISKLIDIQLQFLDIKESGVFNVGTGKPKSFKEVALSICSENEIDYIPMPEILKDSYQKYTCADMTKTNRALNL